MTIKKPSEGQSDKDVVGVAGNVTVLPVLDDAENEELHEKSPYDLFAGTGVDDRAKGGLNEGQYDWTSEEFRDIPELVRNTVSFEDDPTIQCWTFRVAVLSTLFTRGG